MSPAIKIENLSKQYRLGLVSTRTLSHDLNRWYQMKIRGKDDPYLRIGEVNRNFHREDSEYIWALKNINLEVEQGEVLGIIGKNGAGKSTLLKILSKVTVPTTGTVHARGRIASLLEMGTGFHPEMTGRENIYMNGAIMGMNKEEISRKLDEIIDFAGVERYIDTPVKRYSNGMIVRLGFAVAAHLEPEILVVDEVLAVGDAEFQKKAIGKIQNISHFHGKTVLFVSHNMGAIENLCNSGVILQHGEILHKEDVDSAVSKYLKLDMQSQTYTIFKESSFYIKKVSTVDDSCQVTEGYEIIEAPKILIEILNKNVNLHLNNLKLGIALLDDIKNKIFTIEIDLVDAIMKQGSNEIKILVEFPKKLLAPGLYSFSLALHQPNIQIYDEVQDICAFYIAENETVKHYTYHRVRQGSIIVEPSYKFF